jgi:hypothetical protein
MNAIGDIDFLANVNSPAVGQLGGVVSESGTNRHRQRLYRREPAGDSRPGPFERQRSDSTLMNNAFRGFNFRIDPRDIGS